MFAGVYLDAIRRGLTGSRVSVGVHRDEDAVLTFSVREELDGVRFARTFTARPQRTA